MAALIARIAGILERLQQTKPGRAWSRYGDARGNVLAGGITYFAFFSLFPALAIGFTVLGLVVGGRADLQAKVVDYVNSSFGNVTVIGTQAGTGIVTMNTLVKSDVLTTFGVIGAVTLLLAGLGWVGALRDGISLIFGRANGPNPVLAKLGDLGILVSLGLGVLASAVSSVLVTSATGTVLDWLGMGRTRWSGVLVSVLTALVVLAIDTALFLLLFRLLSGVTLVLDDVFTGALVGGVALGLLKVLGGVLLRLTSHNHFLAAFSALIGILIWMNLAARAGLLAAAWAATTAEDRGHLPPLATPEPADDGAPASASSPRPATSRVATGAPGVPSYGVRAGDRTTLAAGAVLGAVAALGLGTLGRAGLAVRDLWRPAPADRDDD
jgi:membrane protein